MTEPDFSHLAALHTLGGDPIPEIVVEVAAGRSAELVWRNELGGLTFRIDDRFVKWNPRRTGIDLNRERVLIATANPRQHLRSVAVLVHLLQPWRLVSG